MSQLRTQKYPAMKKYLWILLVGVLAHAGLLCASAQAASSALAVRCNNTEDSLQGATYAMLDVANVVIHTSELVNGHRYLICYNAAMGSTSNAGEVAVRVMYGTTEIAETNYESDHEVTISVGNIDNGPRSGQGGSLTGFHILTANGSDSLWLERKVSGTNSGYFSGKCLMAINLNNLTNNTHYFDSCVNGSGIVAQDSTDDIAIDTTLLVDTYTLAAGDYMVLASAEIWDSLSSTVSYSKQCYLTLDGTIQGPAGGGKHTWEDGSDFLNWSYARIHTFTAASHTFKIIIGNVDTPLTSEVVVYGRRPRIILIPLSSYADIQTKTHDGFNAITNDNDIWGNDTSMTYTNNTGTTENIVLIANGHIRGVDADDHGCVRILNNTDAVSFSEYTTSNPRENNDTVAVTSIGYISSLANAGSKQIIYQATGDSTLNDQTLGFVSLIAWNLKENLGAPPVAPKIIPIQIGKKEEPCDCEHGPFAEIYNRLLNINRGMPGVNK